LVGGASCVAVGECADVQIKAGAPTLITLGEGSLFKRPTPAQILAQANKDAVESQKLIAAKYEMDVQNAMEPASTMPHSEQSMRSLYSETRNESALAAASEEAAASKLSWSTSLSSEPLRPSVAALAATADTIELSNESSAGVDTCSSSTSTTLSPSHVRERFKARWANISKSMSPRASSLVHENEEAEGAGRCVPGKGRSWEEKHNVQKPAMAGGVSRSGGGVGCHALGGGLDLQVLSPQQPVSPVKDAQKIHVQEQIEILESKTYDVQTLSPRLERVIYCMLNSYTQNIHVH
jgi:hypothetical protein